MKTQRAMNENERDVLYLVVLSFRQLIQTEMFFSRRTFLEGMLLPPPTQSLDIS